MTGTDIAEEVVIPVESVSEAAPNDRFSVRVGDFDGPFDLLLSLISKH